MLIAFFLACRMASSDPTNPPLDAVFPGSAWIDQTHANMGYGLLKTAIWMDNRFSDVGGLTGKTARCTAMIGAEVILEEGGVATVRARGRASFDLPRMEHRLRLFVDNFRYDQLPGVDPAESREELKIGTRWRLLQTVRAMFDFDVGVRARLPPEPFARLRYGYRHQLGDWGFGFDQTEFWSVDDHLGEMTAVTFTHPLGPRWVFRSVTAGKFSQKSEGLESEQTLGFAVDFAGRRRQLDLSGSVFAERNDIVNYRLRLGWSAKWLRPWNRVYVIPELQFPEEADFRARPEVRFGIETVY
jgi:hypothetical protein